mmetsp:Transcript_92436/g.266920  ORF Transcript_92436/g.266920 Transcript_92436/m.266920 type:complete len:388 (-) Transcript_92436:890-2053(-)
MRCASALWLRALGPAGTYNAAFMRRPAGRPAPASRGHDTDVRRASGGAALELEEAGVGVLRHLAGDEVRLEPRGALRLRRGCGRLLFCGLAHLLLGLLQVVGAPIDGAGGDAEALENPSEAVRARDPVVHVLVHAVGVEGLAYMRHALDAVKFMRFLVRDKQQAGVEPRVSGMHPPQQILHLGPRRASRADEHGPVRMLDRKVEARGATAIALGHPHGDGLEVVDRVVPVVDLMREGEPAPLLVEDAAGIVVVVQQLLIPHLLKTGTHHVGDISEAGRPGQVERVAWAVELDLVQQHPDGATVAQRKQRHALHRAQGACPVQAQHRASGDLDPRLQAMQRDHCRAEWRTRAVLVDALLKLPGGHTRLVPHRVDIVLEGRLVHDQQPA